MMCLNNKELTTISSGGSAGSIMLLKMDFEYTLWINCSWRIIDCFTQSVLLTSTDDCTIEKGLYKNVLSRMENTRISKITFVNNWDFQILFSNNFKLEVFSDLTSNGYPPVWEENWEFCDIPNNICYALSGEYKIKIDTFIS